VFQIFFLIFFCVYTKAYVTKGIHLYLYLYFTRPHSRYRRTL
jgi:hypothetical protein